MTREAARLERIIGVVLRTGVAVSSACLAFGLLLSLFGAADLAAAVMNVGVVVLLVTPVARVVVSIVEYAAARDWTFVVLTAIVLVELAASAVFALVFNKRL